MSHSKLEMIINDVLRMLEDSPLFQDNDQKNESKWDVPRCMQLPSTAPLIASSRRVRFLDVVPNSTCAAADNVAGSRYTFIITGAEDWNDVTFEAALKDDLWWTNEEIDSFRQHAKETCRFMKIGGRKLIQKSLEKS
jgi:hypothetical protein